MTNQKPEPLSELPDLPYLVGRVSEATTAELATWVRHPYIGSGGLMDQVSKELAKRVEQAERELQQRRAAQGEPQTDGAGDGVTFQALSRASADSLRGAAIAFERGDIDALLFADVVQAECRDRLDRIAAWPVQPAAHQGQAALVREWKRDGTWVVFPEPGEGATNVRSDIAADRIVQKHNAALAAHPPQALVREDVDTVATNIAATHALDLLMDLPEHGDDGTLRDLQLRFKAAILAALARLVPAKEGEK